MKVMATELLDLGESQSGAMIEPSETLMKTKRVSLGRAVVYGKNTLDHIVITNLSDQKQWLETGTVLDEIEDIEEIAEEKSWDAVFAAKSAEKGETRPEQDYDSIQWIVPE